MSKSIPEHDVPEAPDAPVAHPVPAQDVLLIERMSVKYDGVEDRIAMDIASAQGRVARLWFTRHGCDLLVRATAARVESYATAQLAQANVAPTQAAHLRESGLATQQLTARLTQRRASRVELPPGGPEHLVTGFVMPAGTRHMKLDFVCRSDLTARVNLTAAELFQWLGAVQRQYQRAGWALEVWPAWISPRASQP